MPIDRRLNSRCTRRAQSIVALTIARESAVLSRLPLVALRPLAVGLGGLSHVHRFSSVYLSDGDAVEVMNTVTRGEHVCRRAATLTRGAEHRLAHRSTELRRSPPLVQAWRSALTPSHLFRLHRSHVRRDLAYIESRICTRASVRNFRVDLDLN